jgi:hypothetical protein
VQKAFSHRFARGQDFFLEDFFTDRQVRKEMGEKGNRRKAKEVKTAQVANETKKGGKKKRLNAKMINVTHSDTILPTRVAATC